MNATKEYILPFNDGLEDSWEFKNIFVNPPYGRDNENKTTIKDWIKKCYLANLNYNSEVIALVPVATNVSHWKEYVYNKATAICFLYDTRLKFLEKGKKVGTGAPMACSLIYYGNDYKKFFNHFIDYGAVIDLKPLKGLKIGNY